jgi:predicted secreted hydrolase
LSLTLNPLKPLVRFGEKGVSRKGAEPTAASYYLTFPRLRAEGKLTVNGKPIDVTGEAWMDHEISSSQLGAQQIGWDWLSIQFVDHREMMLYRLRHRDGSADPASRCTWINRDATLHDSEFGWEVLDTWQSTLSGARYPSRVRLTTIDPATGQKTRYLIEPLVKNQELTGQIDDIPYWEGDCQVLDETGKKVLGSAYLELTGYAKELKL